MTDDPIALNPREPENRRHRGFTERDVEQRAYGLWQNDGGKHAETHYWHQAREQLEREFGAEHENAS